MTTLFSNQPGDEGLPGHHRLNHHCCDPVEQMVYFIARLSVTASPVTWMVKRTGNNPDKPFLLYNDALVFIERNGEKDNYIAPLYATARMDMFAEELKYLLLTPSPDDLD